MEVSTEETPSITVSFLVKKSSNSFISIKIMNKLSNNYVKLIKDLCVCPSCKSELLVKKDNIKCKKCQRKFSIIQGIPILIDSKISNSTHNKYKNFKIDKNALKKDKYANSNYINKYLAATNGFFYEKKKNKKIAIPNIDLKTSNSRDLLLDIGCGWGRWCFAASKKNYLPVGIETNLNLLLTAKRYSEENNIDAFFIYADALNLPFKKNKFNTIFSFSVFQHFPKKDFFSVLKSTKNILKKNGLFKFQIMNIVGLRCIYTNFILRKKQPKHFFPEYYFINDIISYCKKYYSKTSVTNCSFFTQARITDYNSFTTKHKIFMNFTYLINTLCKIFPFMKYFSDNVYINLSKK